jgi:hypothetical protein
MLHLDEGWRLQDVYIYRFWINYKEIIPKTDVGTTLDI